MLLVTFHGGGSKHSVNTVFAYTTGSGPQQNPVSKALLNMLYPDGRVVKDRFVRDDPEYRPSPSTGEGDRP